MWSICELPAWACTDVCRVHDCLSGCKAPHADVSDLISHREFKSLLSFFSVASIGPLRPCSFHGKLKSPARIILTLSPSISTAFMTSCRATSRGSRVSCVVKSISCCAFQEVLFAHGIYREIMASLMPFLPCRTIPVYRFHPLESCIR